MEEKTNQILTIEQIQHINENFDKIYQALKQLVDTIVETITGIFKWLEQVLDTKVTVVKRKRKGKRYVPYLTEEKLYLYLRRVKI